MRKYFYQMQMELQGIHWERKTNVFINIKYQNLKCKIGQYQQLLWCNLKRRTHISDSISVFWINSWILCGHKKAYVDKSIRNGQLQVSRRWKTYYNTLNLPCNHQRNTTLNFSNFDFKIRIFQNLTFWAYMSILSHFFHVWA